MHTIRSSEFQQVHRADFPPEHSQKTVWAPDRTLQLFSKCRKTEMNDPVRNDMIEALRLTQAGRLGEATALLQKLLRGERFPNTKPTDSDTTRT